MKPYWSDDPRRYLKESQVKKPEQKRLPEDKAAELRMWIEKIYADPRTRTDPTYVKWAIANHDWILSGEYNDHFAEIRKEFEK